MTGIFPSNGVAATETVNGLTAPVLATSVVAAWYRNLCQPRLNVAAMNALISEVINAVNAGGIAYDSARLDNLARSIQASIGGGVVNQASLTAAINAAIAALKNGAPTGLDTLGEIAAALCNDPDFCANMTATLNALTARLTAAETDLATIQNAGTVDAGTMQAAIDAAIAGVVGGAAAPLDTLQGLANALGNDPNFAANTTAALAALQAGKADSSVMITGGGLATGGGDLTMDRVISVTPATDAEAIAGTRTDVALTPANLAAVLAAHGATGTFTFVIV